MFDKIKRYLRHLKCTVYTDKAFSAQDGIDWDPKDTVMRLLKLEEFDCARVDDGYADKPLVDPDNKWATSELANLAREDTQAAQLTADALLFRYYEQYSDRYHIDKGDRDELSVTAYRYLAKVSLTLTSMSADDKDLMKILIDSTC